MTLDNEESVGDAPTHEQLVATRLIELLDRYEEFQDERRDEARAIILRFIGAVLHDTSDYEGWGVPAEEVRKLEAANFLGEIPPAVRTRLRLIFENIVTCPVE